MKNNILKFTDLFKTEKEELLYKYTEKEMNKFLLDLETYLAEYDEDLVIREYLIQIFTDLTNYTVTVIDGILKGSEEENESNREIREKIYGLIESRYLKNYKN